MKIVFFGSRNSSVKFLEKLIQWELEIVAVVTSPDRPSGRGLKIHPTPVKEFSLAHNLKVFTPENLMNPSFISQLQTSNFQLGIVVAYGKILPKEIFLLPEFGTINIHFSLLPKYRGAAPIQWTLINGEETTGVSIFMIDEGLDTGKILVQKELEISDNDDAITLEDKLVKVGIELLLEVIELFKKFGRNLSLEYSLQSQLGEVSYAPALKKQDGEINWNKSAKEIYNLIRGTKPWPGAYTEVKSKKLKILQAEIVNSYNTSKVLEFTAGTIAGLVKNQGFVVKCAAGFLLIKEVQPENKSPISAWDFWQGARLKVGDKLGRGRDE